MDKSAIVRVCRACGKLTAYEDLVKQKKSKDGVQRLCKKCFSVKQRQWRNENRDRLNEWRRANYIKRRSDHKEQNKQYRRAHKERVNERNRQWHKDHPKNARLRTSKRRTLKLALPYLFSRIDWDRALTFFRDRCAVCGRPQGLWHIISADHWIPMASPDCPGTTPENIVPLCHGFDGCNNSKHDRDPIGWLVERYGQKKADAILQRIYDYFEWVKQQH